MVEVFGDFSVGFHSSSAAAADVVSTLNYVRVDFSCTNKRIATVNVAVAVSVSAVSTKHIGYATSTKHID